MASKSRLGKGLGALFPTLPGEPGDTDEADSAQEHVGVSRETSTNRMKNESQKQRHANVSRETILRDKHVDMNVSRETSTKNGKKSGQKSATMSKESPVADAKVSTASDSHANVSRETSTKSGRVRMAMPAVEGLKHPSDLFFGSDNATGVRPARSKSAHTSMPNDVDDSKKGHDDGADDNADSVEPQLKPVQGGYLVELRLDQIGPNANQPRTIFDEDELQELADSLREVGVLQPVVVRKRPEAQRKAAQEKLDKAAKQASAAKGVAAEAKQSIDKGMASEYELIMGERRWRASRLAGLKTIPAIVKTTSDSQMLRDALLENLHRVALNPLEEAAAYQQMMDDFGLTQEQLSKSISKSRPQIANTLRLLNLPPSVQKKVGAGVLSAGHARALLGLQTEEDMDKLAQRILAEGLSVRSTEEIVAMKTMSEAPAKKPEPKRKNPWRDSPIAQNLENHFDTKVAIKGSKKRGRIEIVFSSPEDMDRILDILMPKGEDSSKSQWV